MRFQPKPSLPGHEPSAAGNTVSPMTDRPARRRKSGYTFIEVLISLIVVAVVFGSIINGYLSTSTRGQWTAYSLAAQSLGLQTLEQARSGVWDIALGKNEITQMTLLNASGDGVSTPLTGYTTNVLDVPWKGNNAIWATNFITIKTIYENNYSTVPVQVLIIRVDTVWPFTAWGGFHLSYYTNSVGMIVAPDNRDPSTLGVGG